MSNENNPEAPQPSSPPNTPPQERQPHSPSPCCARTQLAISLMEHKTGESFFFHLMPTTMGLRRSEAAPLRREHFIDSGILLTLGDRYFPVPGVVCAALPAGDAGVLFTSPIARLDREARRATQKMTGTSVLRKWRIPLLEAYGFSRPERDEIRRGWDDYMKVDWDLCAKVFTTITLSMLEPESVILDSNGLPLMKPRFSPTILPARRWAP